MAKFFINRPIVAIVIAIITVIIGVVSLLGLPISQFPNIVPPQISIKTTYTGADALTVEQSVATPIEQQLSGVDNMNYMYSINANNGSLALNVFFDLATDPNVDQILCQMREGQAEAQLPTEVKNYGITIKKSYGLPLLLVDLYSPKQTYDMLFLANYAQINMLDQISRVPGVGDVQILSGGQYAMRIWVKPDQLAKLNITISEIANAVNNQNKVNPAGQIGSEPVPKGQEFTYSVRARAACRRRRNSAKSSCGRTPMARWCGSRMWRASSSGAATTTASAGSTVSRAPSSGSTRCPAPTPSTPPTASRS